jgi:signal peptidase II
VNLAEPPLPAEAPEVVRRHRPPGPLSGLGFGLIALVVAVDQISKWIAEATLPYAEGFDILPFLALYRTYNTGVAFSMFAGSGALTLIIAMLVITAVVLYLWARADEGGRLAAAGYALIVGGAVGNLVDRLIHGHVIDFLLLHFGERTLFVFNLADAALSLGPVLVLAVFVFAKRPAD